MSFSFLRALLITSLVACSLSAETALSPSAVSPLDGMKPGYNAASFNPAMGLTLDATARNTTASEGGFDFRSAEVNLMASVDPFANLYAVINGTSDGVEVEEAAFMTTSLPYNLTVRGGRFFANFGRLAHWHDHELPFVNRTASLENFIGGEAQAEGAELIHLFKTPFFLQGTLGAYNKMGAENTRLEETGTSGHTGGRGWASMTYLGRLFSYVPLGDDFGVDLGASESLTPRQRFIGGTRYDPNDSARSLTGIDVTFRFEPLSQNVYRRAIWSTEIFRNDERRLGSETIDTDNDGIPDTDVNTFERKKAWGGFSYVDWRFAQRWSGGGFFDLSENLDLRTTNTKTYGVTLNFLPSQFQRIRLQLSQVRANDGSPTDDQIFLQWFGTIGSHVHVFKDR